MAWNEALIEQAWEAFQREAPLLIPEHVGEWVAYHGDQPIRFGKTKTELYQQCLQRGLAAEEFLVLCIEPEAAEVLFLPPDLS